MLKDRNVSQYVTILKAFKEHNHIERDKEKKNLNAFCVQYIKHISFDNVLLRADMHL